MSPLIWKVKFPGRVMSAPIPAGGRCFLSDEAEHVTALEAASGRLLWRQHVPGSLATVTEIAVDADIVYVAGVHAITALGVEDGSLLWRTSREAFPQPAPVWGKPVAEQLAPALTVVKDGLLVVRYQGVSRLERTTGRIVWWDSVGAYLIGPAAVNGQTAAVTTGFGCAGWHCGTGELLWTQEIPSSLVNVAPAAAGDGVAYTGTGDGVLAAVRTDTGDLLWRTEAHAAGFRWGRRVAVGEAPVVGADHVTGLTQHGVLFCHDRQTGESKWSRKLPARIIPSQTPLDARTVVSADGGWLKAWDMGSGENLWRARLSPVRVSPVTHAEGLFYYATPYAVAACRAPVGSSPQRG